MNIEDIHQALEVLGIPPLVTKLEIKKRYRDLAKRYHPDQNPSEAGEMEKINQAYEKIMEYINNFRFHFDDEEIKRQIPNNHHNEKFKI